MQATESQLITFPYTHKNHKYIYRKLAPATQINFSGAINHLSQVMYVPLSVTQFWFKRLRILIMHLRGCKALRDQGIYTSAGLWLYIVLHCWTLYFYVCELCTYPLYAN